LIKQQYGIGLKFAENLTADGAHKLFSASGESEVTPLISGVVSALGLVYADVKAERSG